MSRFASKGPSQRQLRVGELIRHALSDLLTRGDLYDPDLTSSHVTIGEVRMSPDLKIATIFVAPLGGGDGKALVKALAKNAKFIRGHVARAVNLKFAPDVRFRHDESFDEASKIDALLRQPIVRRDLQAPEVNEQTDEDGGDA